MHLTSDRSFLFVTLILLAACDDGGETPTPAPQELTYHRDNAPLYERHCTGCHTEGGIAPFRLDEYEPARLRASLAAELTADRVMPPFGVDASGECNTFQDARWLTDEEIDTIARWAAAGAPEGDPADRPAPVGNGGPTLGGTIVSARMARAYEPPPTEIEEYRCFDVPLDVDGDVFVTGFEVVPGHAPIVHHVVVWTFDPAAVEGESTNAETIAALEGADGRPGWPCGGTGGGISTSSMPAIWTPGTPVTRFPAGTGIRIRDGHRLMFEMHYHLQNGASTDQTELRLEVAPSVEREAEMALVDGLLASLFRGDPFVLAGGEDAIEFSWESTMANIAASASMPGPGGPPAPAGIDIYGVFPHMHLTGSRLQADLATGDATAACLATIPVWQFEWQQVFFYEAPIRMTGDDRMRVTCTYDTSGRREPTSPGFGTEDEMCTLGVFFVREGTSSACVGCADASIGAGEACTDDGSPSSAELLDALMTCTCDASFCGDACADNACASSMPTEACLACLDSTCAEQQAACL
jgi:hypothetical protein